MDIEIVGPYPPPYGGVSSHIYRLIKYLKEAKLKYLVLNQYSYFNHDEHIYATKNTLWFWIKYMFTKNKNLVHFHPFSLFQFPYFAIYSLINNKNIIISLHYEITVDVHPLINYMIIYSLKFSKYESIIAVSKNSYDFLKQYNIKNLIHLPAYVPPFLDEQGEKKASEGAKKNVFFNMWKAKDTLFGIYGVELLLSLYQDYKDSCNFYLFSGSNEGIEEFKQEMLKRNAEGINIMVNENLVEHFYYCDIFLRLNNNDAYGISIQEALDCNVIAIASDVCKRPQGAVLFKTGDYQDLKQVFEKVLNYNEEEIANVIKGKENLNYHLELIQMYKDYLKKLS